MMEKRPHLEPGRCPGYDYFERKKVEDEDRIRTIMMDVLGDVPHYMKMAADNRVWLWVLSASLVITGLILIII
jgi:hypothetical protein